MKYIFSSILLAVLVVPALVLAQTEENKVWFTGVPDAVGATAAPNKGDDILIYARLNNTTKDPIMYTVTFSTVPESIGTKTATVPPYTEQSVSIQWLMPEAPLIATATITKALDKNKKEIVSLKDTVIGTVSLSNSPDLPKLSNVKGFFNKALVGLESWRLKQLDYFTKLKKDNESVLGTTTLKDVSDVFKPEVPATPREEESAVDVEKPDRRTMDYVKLVYATMGQYYFAHKTFFYVSVVLIGLLVLRFFFRRFF